MTLFEKPSRNHSLFGQFLWFLLWLGVTVVGMILHPSSAGHGTHEQLGLPPCPSVLIFNRPCPGCGLTTSWSALLHGDIAFAFHAHPLGPLMYAAFTFSAIAALIGWRRGERLVTDSVEASRALIAASIIFIGFGIVRMAVTPHFATTPENLLAGRAQ